MAAVSAQLSSSWFGIEFSKASSRMEEFRSGVSVMVGCCRAPSRDTRT